MDHEEHTSPCFAAGSPRPARDLAPIVRIVHAPQAQSGRRVRAGAFARDLLRRVRSEHSSPREIGLAVAAGVFAGCAPFGFHGLVAVALATLLRLNRLWAFVASRTSILPIYLLILFCEIEAGHLFRTGQFARLSPSEAFAHRSDLLTEWVVGTLVVGSALAAFAGLLAYACARAWPWRTAPGDAGNVAGGPPSPRSLSPRRLDESRRPSSESRTSAPPDPSP
jgi:uncharacterized protein (DUF2062 family)